MLKIIDLVILELEGNKLSYDTMQFAYQARSSTTICSWAVTAVVDHFLRNGAKVFSAAMDMSKAFDMVDWKELFTTLSERQIDALFLWLILYIYTNQQCNVNWCGKSSQQFEVQNGVRQGAVTSGIFFAVYIDELIRILRRTGLGCHIHGIFYGAMIFADDIILLSASRTGLQAMVNTCYDFALSKNLKFGTNADPSKSKTKCILFSKKRFNTMSLGNITLGGDSLPWVSQIKHLGHILQENNSMKIDIAQKRAAYIGKVNSLLQEFSNVTPSILIKLVNTFASTVYGSNLWDVFSDECERLFTSYSVTIRNILNLHRCTHRYFIEPLSKTLHLKTMVLGKLVTFYRSLLQSDKLPVRFLARLQEHDERTVMGHTITKLSIICNVDRTKISAAVVKAKLCFRQIPDSEKWRESIANELLRVREADLEVPGFTNDEISEILDYVCIS